MGLQLETVVSRLSKKVGGRLAHCRDSYEIIGADEGPIDIIREGNKPTWVKSAPWQRVTTCNPTISAKVSNAHDTEVPRLLGKGAICEVGWVHGQNS